MQMLLLLLLLLGVRSAGVCSFCCWCSSSSSFSPSFLVRGCASSRASDFSQIGWRSVTRPKGNWRAGREGGGVLERDIDKSAYIHGAGHGAARAPAAAAATVDAAAVCWEKPLTQMLLLLLLLLLLGVTSPGVCCFCCWRSSSSFSPSFLVRGCASNRASDFSKLARVLLQDPKGNWWAGLGEGAGT